MPGSDNTAARNVDRGRTATSPPEIPVEGWKDIARRTRHRVTDDHTTLAAAGVAFYAFLAVVPALAAVVSLYGLIASPADVRARVEDLFSAVPTEARDLLTSQLENVAGQSGSALTTTFALSLAVALWSASSAMSNLMEALNIAYEEDDDRNFLIKRGLALVLTLGAVVFVIVAIAAIAAVPPLLEETDLPGWLQWLLRLATWPVLMAAFAAGLAVLYRYAPDRDAPEWRWVSWGSALAVVAWAIVSVGFRFYVGNFGSYNETYGSLSAVVVLLLWLFLTSLVVLLGATVNAEMEHQTVHDTTQGPDRPMGRRDAHVADTLGQRSSR